MPFTDPVSSVSGRNSRASNVSGATGASRSQHRSPPTNTNDTLASAGVLSMLKTSTDTGDIGALSFNTSRLPGMPGAARTRRAHHHSRPSASAHPHITSLSSNHSYAPSQTSRISSQWDNTSTTQRRGSLTSMQSMPPSLPPLHNGKPSLQMTHPTADGNPRDSRSYSMTSAPQVGQLPRHRSAASLKSQGHEPRHGNRMPPGPVPPMPENRPPFVYPTRLKRPGFRSPSPALSDTYGPGLPPGVPPMTRRAPGPHPPPMTAYNGYNVAYAPDYNPHLNVRPPLRTANSSPGPGYGPNQFAYQQGPMRPPPGMSMLYQMQPPYSPQQQMPPRAQYGPQFPSQQPGYAPYSTGPPRQGYRGPPPQASMGPMAHQMFHNAARMARQLPHRTDTPLTDAGPPSSDGPSSSAPDSSNPPTPKDHTTIRVVVDPAFIDPALVDLQDSSSEPVLPNAKYFEYADGLDRQIDDAEMEVPHPSVPPSGFVQRVKAMLESKAAAEAAALNENERAMQGQLHHRPPQYLNDFDIENDHEEVSELLDVHEMAANETPRFTVIEEFEAPVELPASPVKVAELDAIETAQNQTTRITRDMIRAELSVSSIENTLQQVQPDESTANVLAQLVERGDESHALEHVELPADEAKQALVIHTRRASQQTNASARSGKRRQDSVPEAITEVSIEASLPTGADYALRFSAPHDTTIASQSYDETQSKDPFALDADTITMQQQPSVAKDFARPPNFADGKKTPVDEVVRQTRYLDMTPVSPLRPGEEVKRSSAVSPIQDDNRGIDETFLQGVEDTREATTMHEATTFDSLAAETDLMPPPTPRTPKTYSKSVQLPPSAMVADTNSTCTNRFSLPGDLSTMGDTTINSGSEMITDVAVRFSLPGTTITIGKPQIIDVSTSSTPDRLKFDPLVSRTPQHADLKSSRRHSVTFAEDIAPLNVHKKGESSRAAGDGQLGKGKSIIRPSRDDTFDSATTKSSRDNTADSRHAGTNAATSTHTRFGSTHLPGLKEESIEDMSSPDHKRETNNDFPLPSRIAAVKAMQERRLQESADKAKARRAARKHNRPLGETKDLPSLNFSRTDLFEKLNEALEVRPSKSMDVIRRRDFSAIHCPSPQRPMSTEPLRERYTSFFSKPDEFSFLEETPVGDDEEEVEEEQTAQNETDESKALVPMVQVQENTQIENEGPRNRPLSPDDFLNVASQVNRLSIPSVAGLSERISELIPGLRNLSNLQLDSLLSSNDMHPGYPASGFGRPDTVMTNRTSAGFRTLAERAEEIVVNGTHDSIAPGITAMALNKELPPLPGSTSSDQFPGVNSVDGKASYLSGSVSMPTDLGKDPTRPLSALLRSKIPTTEEEVRELLPKEMNPITRMANRRSMILSQPSSRPWNVDKNYPWSATEIEIDLSVPSPAHTRKSCASELLRERRTRSLDIPNTSTSNESKGIDIGSITASHHGSRNSISTEQLTGFSPQHYRKASKRSIIGSITRKFGLSPRSNAATDEDATSKSLPKSPVPRQTSVMSHKPGDRYPTSSLTPPAIAALDEVRSFFSDNSSERDRTASFRKRLTNFKGKGKAPLSINDQQLRSHSMDEPGTEYNAGSMIEARAGSESAAHAYEGVGMSKTEFHFKRFGEKLRIFFAKSGDLIRSWSTRGRPNRRFNGQQDEWLADSVYSGV